LNPSGITLNWTDEHGNSISEPAGTQVSWASVPDTTKITNETGTLKIKFVDGTATSVDIPVVVQGATAGDVQKVHQNDTVPAASGSVNTSSVDHFGITSDQWSKAPSTATPGARVPGTVRVNYADGTYQDVDVNIDVIGVENGLDHKDDPKVYRLVGFDEELKDINNQTVKRHVVVEMYKFRYTDYAFGENHPSRVTYSDWHKNMLPSNSTASSLTKLALFAQAAPVAKSSTSDLPFTIKKQEAYKNVGDDLSKLLPKDFIANLPECATAELVWDTTDGKAPTTAGDFKAHIKITLHKTDTTTTPVEIAPQDEIIAYNQGTKVIDEKSTTRTIHYQGAGTQTPADEVETVTWTKKQNVDDQGNVTIIDWSTDNGQFKNVPTPVIAGYTADKDHVASSTPKIGDPDFTVTVTYTENSNPETPGKTPDTPKPPKEDPKKDDPNKPDQPAGKSAKTTEKKQNGSKLINKHGTTSSNIEKLSSTTATHKQAQAALPQTGSSRELSLAAIVGILSIGLSLAAALFTSKKKHS
jgi:LPXTG-motif cell wall-anchored protein